MGPKQPAYCPPSSLCAPASVCPSTSITYTAAIFSKASDKNYMCGQTWDTDTWSCCSLHTVVDAITSYQHLQQASARAPQHDQDAIININFDHQIQNKASGVEVFRHRLTNTLPDHNTNSIVIPLLPDYFDDEHARELSDQYILTAKYTVTDRQKRSINADESDAAGVGSYAASALSANGTTFTVTPGISLSSLLRSADGTPASPVQLGCGRSLPASQHTGRALGSDAASAKEGQYPWHVAIVTPKLSYLCGGVIVADRHVLTVAHCVKHLTAKDTIVRLGDYDLSTDAESNPSYDVAVRKITCHPDYVRKTLTADLCVLEVEYSMLQLSHVARVCLPGQVPHSDKQECYVPSWGYVQPDKSGVEHFNTYTSVLKDARYVIIDESTCQRQFRTVKSLGSFFKLLPGFLCCKGILQTDTCHGDGGSGLVCRTSTGDYVLQGLVSWSVGCAHGLPTAFVDVNYYLPFILNSLATSTYSSVGSQHLGTQTVSQNTGYAYVDPYLTGVAKEGVQENTQTLFRPPTSSGQPPLAVRKEQTITSPPTSVYKEDSHTPSPPVYKKEDSYAPPVYKEDSYAPPPPVYKEDSYAPPVYKKEDSYAPPVYKEDSYAPPPPVYKEDSYALPVYKEDSYAPPPLCTRKILRTPPPVYKEDSYAPPVYKKKIPSSPVYKEDSYAPLPVYKKEDSYALPVYKEESYAPPVYKEDSYAPPVYKKDSSPIRTPPPPVYKEHAQAPPVYKEDSYAPPVYKEDSYAPPVYKEHAQAPPVYKEHAQAPPVYKEHAQAPPVYKEHAQAPPVYKEHAQAPPVYKEHAQAPPVYKEESYKTSYKPPGYRREDYYLTPVYTGDSYGPPSYKEDAYGPLGYKDDSYASPSYDLDGYGPLNYKEDSYGKLGLKEDYGRLGLKGEYYGESSYDKGYGKLSLEERFDKYPLKEGVYEPSGYREDKYVLSGYKPPSYKEDKYEFSGYRKDDNKISGDRKDFLSFLYSGKDYQANYGTDDEYSNSNEGGRYYVDREDYHTDKAYKTSYGISGYDRRLGYGSYEDDYSEPQHDKYGHDADYGSYDRSDSYTHYDNRPKFVKEGSVVGYLRKHVKPKLKE
nr:uncharacterized protein LOC128704945 [Cherax quadricarinatus]